MYVKPMKWYDCASSGGVNGLNLLHLSFDYHSESDPDVIFFKLTHIQVLIKKMHEARFKCFVLFKSRECFLSFFGILFRYSYNKIFWGP